MLQLNHHVLFWMSDRTILEADKSFLKDREIVYIAIKKNISLIRYIPFDGDILFFNICNKNILVTTENIKDILNEIILDSKVPEEKKIQMVDNLKNLITDIVTKNFQEVDILKNPTPYLEVLKELVDEKEYNQFYNILYSDLEKSVSSASTFIDRYNESKEKSGDVGLNK